MTPEADIVSVDFFKSIINSVVSMIILFYIFWRYIDCNLKQHDVQLVVSSIFYDSIFLKRSIDAW